MQSIQSEDFEQIVQKKIDAKTKPLGSLGLIEKLAKQICLVQNTLKPCLRQAVIVVFAADHGISDLGVSAYPSDVTAQMVKNFLNGGAAINVFCKQHGIALKIVDAGVRSEFTPNNKLIDARIANGTKNFQKEPAMTKAQLEKCFELSNKIIDQIATTDCNIIGFGEMGIGNTSAASILMSYLCGLPIEQCVGKGTGLNDDQLQHKLAVLKQATENHPIPKDVYESLMIFGGFEIAQMCGAMLASYKKNMLIMIDGFIASVAYLCAYKILPSIQKNAIFCHQSDEHGHQTLLNYLQGSPLLNLNMRLGEGTGCALAFPIIQSAVSFINEMASFEEANISNQLAIK